MPTSWYDQKTGPKYPKLTGRQQADVVIIGGGLAGVWSAYMLSDNLKVALLEADALGAGATIDTTAFITEIIDTDAPELVKLFGGDTAQKVYEAGGIAIEAIASVVNKEKIDCEFERCVANVFASEPDQYPAIEEEFEILKSLKVDVQMHVTHDLKFINYGHYEVKNQAKYHPMKFLHGLARAASENGVKFFEQTEARRVEGEGPFRIKTAEGEIECKTVIVCTYNPFNKPHEVFAKKGMYKSFVLEIELPKGRLLPGLYWDKHNPYNYFRIDAKDDFDRMILGGQDHRYELPVDREQRFALLEDYLKKILPETAYKITQKWAGPILEPSDGLPLIGEYREGQMLAAGFSGNGMTYSPIAAMIFKDIIEGGKSPWQKIFDPDRTLKPYRLWEKGSDYVEEFFNGVIKNFFK